MKKLLLLLLLIPNLVMAETWVCSYLHQGEIKTNTYKRVGNEFHRKINDELTSKYEIWNESDFQIKLINTKKDDIGIGATLLTRSNPPSFSSIYLAPKASLAWSSELAWSGDCEVVK